MSSPDPRHVDELLAEAELRTPERDLADILDVSAATAFLCSPFAKLITRGTIYLHRQYQQRPHAPGLCARLQPVFRLV